jgi:hypothetical protein
MANDSGTANPPWWTLAQILVWIIRQVERSPQDAEQFCTSPEWNPKIIERALNALTRALFDAVYGTVEGMPIVKARVLCGRRYVDLATFFQLPSPLEPNAADALMHEIRQLIGQLGVEFNPIWGRTTWPASTSEVEAAPAPVADAALKPTALESPQAVASEQSPSPDKQLNDPAVGLQASAGTQSAPEQPEACAQSTPEQPEALAMLPSLNGLRTKLAGLIAARATTIAQVVNASATPRAPKPPPKPRYKPKVDPLIEALKEMYPPHGDVPDTPHKTDTQILGRIEKFRPELEDTFSPDSVNRARKLTREAP